MPKIELVGSRRIVPHLVNVETDYDYIAEDTAENCKWLEENGWKLSNTSREYFDIATTNIYHDENFNQCCLKSPEYWPAVKAFWKMLDENMNLFIQRYWKSASEPISREDIRKSINLFLYSARYTE